MHQPPIVRFSTAGIPERDRLATFREMFGGSFALDISPLGEECRAEVELHLLPGASVTWGANSAHRFTWDGKAQHRAVQGRRFGISEEDCLVTWAASPVHFRHLGREIAVDAGSVMLVSCTDKAVVEQALPTRHVTLKLPRAALKPLVADLNGAFMRPVSEKSGALRLLKCYVAMLQEYEEATSPELRRTMVLHICDLVALIFGATSDAAQLAGKRGVAAARLDAMKKHILEHLDEPSLSVEDVARAQAVTPRYVQMLFEGDGRTFSSFLLQSRLALAHRRLRDRASAQHPIGAIAADCGFGDLSYFNQSFRRTYGETPSDVRNRARRDFG